MSTSGAAIVPKTLQIFEGFQLELASEFTGLSAAQINTLRKHKVVRPKRSGGAYIYSFQDLVALRLVRILRELEVKPSNIVLAHKYLVDLDIGQDLKNTKLYLQIDSRDILALGDDEAFAALNRGGQLVAKKLVEIIPVGRPLENLRQRIIRFDRNIQDGLSGGKTVSLSELRKKYASA